MENITERIEGVCDSLKSVLLRKNKDYGNSALTSPALLPDMPLTTAINVRMSDKISRLRTLLSGEQDSVGESIDDTLMDLAGYCVLQLVARSLPPIGNKEI